MCSQKKFLVSFPPFQVNYYEAKAFCRWKSDQQTESSITTNNPPFRVLTEAEHHVLRHRDHNLDAARNQVSADPVMTESGHSFSSSETVAANLNLSFSSHSPVQAFPPTHTGHYDVSGNGWEWTEDHFNPLPNFKVHPVYDDFSMPCFDGKHNMIVGGSFISTGDEASVFARFHFRRHFLQHSGFRLVASNHDAPATYLLNGEQPANVHSPVPSQQKEQESMAGTSPDATTNTSTYETEESLHMYLGLHYPHSGERENVPCILPHDQAPKHGLFFPQRIAQLLVSLQSPEQEQAKALDVGCAVGGASFELAKHFDAVDAFDFSHSFVDAAKQMQTEATGGDEVHFRVPIEADIHQTVRAFHASDITDTVRSKVHFFTGDACHLESMKTQGILDIYDGVLMSNLLCRLPNPVACLNGLPTIVKEGGVVVLVTPFTWLSDFTPRDQWLGGYYRNDNGGVHPNTPVRSKVTLEQIMESNGFEKIHEEDMPLLIREHVRKYQYIVSLATGWRRTAS